MNRRLDLDDEASNAATPGEPPADPRYWVAALGGDAVAERIVAQAGIAQAISSASPAHIRDAFERRLDRSGDRAERARLTRALADRRLLAEPIRKPPEMFTLNGCGTTCRGRDDVAADGTYITTQVLSLLWIPIWPLRQFLVADAPGGAWYFLAKVKLSKGHRLWRKLVAAAGVLLVLGIGYALFDRQTYDDVHFVNGLDVPVAISAGEEELTLTAGERKKLRLPSGPCHIEARLEDGTVLETADVEVPGGSDLVVYNVLGLAPVYIERVTYLRDGSTETEADNANEVRWMTGKNWFVEADVDHVFEEAPERISMRRHAKVEMRVRSGVADGGWRAGLGLMAPAEAAALAHRMALLTPHDPEAVYVAYNYVAQLEDDAAELRFVEALLAATPDSVENHRVYQTHFERHGRVGEILPKYKAAYEANPQGAREAYLYARLSPADVALPIYERLVPRHPKDPWLRRGLGWLHFQAGRFAECLPHYRMLARTTKTERVGMTHYVVRALAGLGKHAEALETLTRRFPAGSNGKADLMDGNFLHVGSYYACLRKHVPGSPSTAEFMSRFVDGGEPPTPAFQLLAAAYAGDDAAYDVARKQVDDEAIRMAGEVEHFGHRDTTVAAYRAAKLEASALRPISDDVLHALACHWVAKGEPARAQAALEACAEGEAATLEQLQALPSVDGLSEDLDIATRAVLLLVASKQVEDPEKSRELRERARRLDVFGRIVRD